MTGVNVSEPHTSELNCDFTYMWQSCVEIEDYSIMYFNCITAFKAPYC